MEKIIVKQSNTGVGFTGLLAIAFIVLKLLGIINWSWWWVTAPIWIPVVLIILIVVIVIIAQAIGGK